MNDDIYLKIKKTISKVSIKLITYELQIAQKEKLIDSKGEKYLSLDTPSYKIEQLDVTIKNINKKVK